MYLKLEKISNFGNMNKERSSKLRQLTILSPDVKYS